MAHYDYSNEKRMQGMFNLKERPERFTSKERACKYAIANNYHKTYAVLVVGKNPAGLIEGYYVTSKWNEAERMVEDTCGAIQMIGAWEIWRQASK